MKIETLTPILYVEAIEPILPFWVDALGFTRIAEVREGDRLGFVILQRGDVQVMVQTRESVEADVPAIGDTPMGGCILYLRVDDLEALASALDEAVVLVPRRTTPYGAEEIFVREPGGNVVGFAQFPAASAGGAD